MFEKRGVKTQLAGSAGRASGGLRRDPDARRDAHGGLLRALRRAAARSEGMGDAAVGAGAARPAARQGRPRDRAARERARSIRSGGSTRARPATTRRRIVAIATALDALKAAQIPLRSNIKFVFEGEEEAGSPHLAQIIAQVQGPAEERRLADLRRTGAPEPPAADRVRRARRHQLEITLYGPSHELHSGHYGNWAPNPGDDAGAAAGVDEGR